MPAPISTIPQGLLGLLQLKELGVNPGTLANSVAPNLELFNFYIQRLMQGELGLFGSAIDITGINSHGQVGLLTVVGGLPAAVPTNEMWYVDFYSLGGSLAAADFIRLAPAILPTPAAGQLDIVGPDFNDAVTARAREFYVTASRPFFAPPGCQFGCRIADCTSAGGITINGALRAARIPI